MQHGANSVGYSWISVSFGSESVVQHRIKSVYDSVNLVFESFTQVNHTSTDKLEPG